MSSVCLIVNPRAGRSTAKKRLPRTIASFAKFGITDIRETRSPGDEEHVTRAALDAGCGTIAVVGGDGTCAKVANTILKSAANCRLGVIACGTGNDFAKTLGVLHFSTETLARLCTLPSKNLVDVGFVDDHYFLNSCGFGFDASVLEASSRIRFLKGDAVYIYAALRQLFSYRGIDVSPDGAPGVQRGKMLMVTVSNGRYLGGAFKIAPHASVLDGKLDACFFSDANVLERARLFAGALRGTHLGMSSVSAISVQQLSLTFPEKPAMEMDGELRIAGSRTVEFTCVPRALSVIAAPGALT